MRDNFLPLISISISLLIPAIIFLARSTLLAYINEKTRANFENQIESVRSDLRKAEDAFRAELQSKERHFTTLVDSAFADQISRRELIAARKIEALESIWRKFSILGQLKASAIFYQNFKIEAIEREAQTNKNLQSLLKNMTKYDLSEIATSAKPDLERLYIPEIVWAIYSAYNSILFTIGLHLQAMSLGIEEPGKLINWDKVHTTVTSVLPHQAKFLEKYGPTAFPMLLDEIELTMLKEIRLALENHNIDQESLERAKRILEAAQSLSATNNASALPPEQGK
jgi:hypothetical protein